MNITIIHFYISLYPKINYASVYLSLVFLHIKQPMASKSGNSKTMVWRYPKLCPQFEFTGKIHFSFLLKTFIISYIIISVAELLDTNSLLVFGGQINYKVIIKK